MKPRPIPGYPGHPWAVDATATDGRPIRLRVARHRGGALDVLIRKHPRATTDPDGAWYIRIPGPSGKPGWRRISPDAPAPWTPEGCLAAVRNALDEVTAAALARDPYATARARAAYRASITLAGIVADWRGLGMPDTAGRPRTPDQQGRLAPFLDIALRWWGDRDPAAVTQRAMRDYHAHRVAESGGRGSRSVDLELVALSNACAWAVADDRLNANPFAQRPRFRAAADVDHCADKQPASDEELHRIAARILADPDTAPSGARYLFHAMTGLRPGESLPLRWDAQPTGPGRADPGWQFTDAGGVRRMVVRRSKAGINPAVEIHPALADMLDAWRAYHAARWPGCPWMFPSVTGRQADSDRMSRDVAEAARALGLPPRTGHGARAYFVSVHRAQGRDDAWIAAALGQRSGAGLVVAVYGDPGQFRGDGRLDWIPEGMAPAWSTLASPPQADVIRPAFGT